MFVDMLGNSPLERAVGTPTVRSYPRFPQGVLAPKKIIGSNQRFVRKFRFHCPLSADWVKHICGVESLSNKIFTMYGIKKTNSQHQQSQSSDDVAAPGASSSSFKCDRVYCSEYPSLQEKVVHYPSEPLPPVDPCTAASSRKMWKELCDTCGLDSKFGSMCCCERPRAKIVRESKRNLRRTKQCVSHFPDEDFLNVSSVSSCNCPVEVLSDDIVLETDCVSVKVVKPDNFDFVSEASKVTVPWCVISRRFNRCIDRYIKDRHALLKRKRANQAMRDYSVLCGTIDSKCTPDQYSKCFANYTFCCDHMCSKTRVYSDGELGCISCRNASKEYCICNCVTYKVAKRIRSMFRSNAHDNYYSDLLVHDVESNPGPQYCCEKKCFVVPQCQVDGLACKYCQSYSYCQCNCVTWCQKWPINSQRAVFDTKQAITPAADQDGQGELKEDTSVNITLTSNRQVTKSHASTKSFSIKKTQDCFGEEVYHFPNMTNQWLRMTPVKFSTGNGMGNIITSYQIPHDILYNNKSSSVYNAVQPFTYARCKTRMKFQVNANPFQAGIYIAAYRYFETTGSVLDITDARQLLQLPHVLINLQTSNDTEMDIEFIYPFPAMFIQNNSSGIPAFYYATVYIGCLAPLRTGAEGETEVEVLVSGMLTDMYLYGKRDVRPPINPCPTASFDQKQGLLSYAATAIGSVSGVVDAVEGLVQSFGKTANEDKPPLPVEPVAFFRRQNPTWSTGDGSCQPLQMKLDPTSTTSFVRSFIPSAADYDLDKICRTKGWFGNFTLTTADQRDKYLWGWDISPRNFHTIVPYDTVQSSVINPVNSSTPIRQYIAPPISVVSSYFGQYKGDMILEFHCATTQQHTARLRVVQEMLWKNNSDVRQLTSVVFDIKDKTVFSFRVADMQPWIGNSMHTNNLHLSNSKNNYNFISVPTFGRIMVTVENELRAMEAVSSTVDIFMTLRAADNFSLAVPAPLPVIVNTPNFNAGNSLTDSNNVIIPKAYIVVTNEATVKVLLHDPSSANSRATFNVGFNVLEQVNGQYSIYVGTGSSGSSTSLGNIVFYLQSDFTGSLLLENRDNNTSIRLTDAGTIHAYYPQVFYVTYFPPTSSFDQKQAGEPRTSIEDEHIPASTSSPYINVNAGERINIYNMNRRFVPVKYNRLYPGDINKVIYHGGARSLAIHDPFRIAIPWYNNFNAPLRDNIRVADFGTMCHDAFLGSRGSVRYSVYVKFTNLDKSLFDYYVKYIPNPGTIVDVDRKIWFSEYDNIQYDLYNGTMMQNIAFEVQETSSIGSVITFEIPYTSPAGFYVNNLAINDSDMKGKHHLISAHNSGIVVFGLRCTGSPTDFNNDAYQGTYIDTEIWRAYGDAHEMYMFQGFPRIGYATHDNWDYSDMFSTVIDYQASAADPYPTLSSFTPILSSAYNPGNTIGTPSVGASAAPLDLTRDGDVEKNPGPDINDKNILQVFKEFCDRYKIIVNYTYGYDENSMWTCSTYFDNHTFMFISTSKVEARRGVTKCIMKYIDDKCVSGQEVKFHQGFLGESIETVGFTTLPQSIFSSNYFSLFASPFSGIAKLLGCLWFYNTGYGKVQSIAPSFLINQYFGLVNTAFVAGNVGVNYIKDAFEMCFNFLKGKFNEFIDKLKNLLTYFGCKVDDLAFVSMNLYSIVRCIIKKDYVGILTVLSQTLVMVGIISQAAYVGIISASAVWDISMLFVGEDDKQAPPSKVPSMYDDVMLCLGSAICVGLGLETSKCTSMLQSVCTGFEKAIHGSDKVTKLLNCFMRMFDRIMNYFLQEKAPDFQGIIKLQENADDIMKWSQDVFRYTSGGFNESVITNPVHNARVTELFIEGQKYMNIVANGEPEIKNCIMYYYTLIKKQYDRLGQIGSRFESTYDPYCVYIAGKPGTCKSSIIDDLCVDAMRAARIICESYPIYTRCAGNEFWNNYNGEPCIKYDDFAIINGPDHLDKFALEICSIRTSTEFNVNMADLSDKNKFAKCRLLAVCSNHEYPKIPKMPEVSAFYRRRNVLIRAEIKKPYLDKLKSEFGTQSLSANVFNVHPEWLEENGRMYPCLEFTLLNPTDSNNQHNVLKKGLSYENIKQQIIYEFILHDKNEIERVASRLGTLPPLSVAAYEKLIDAGKIDITKEELEKRRKLKEDAIANPNYDTHREDFVANKPSAFDEQQSITNYFYKCEHSAFCKLILKNPNLNDYVPFFDDARDKLIVVYNGDQQFSLSAGYCGRYCCLHDSNYRDKYLLILDRLSVFLNYPKCCKDFPEFIRSNDLVPDNPFLNRTAKLLSKVKEKDTNIFTYLKNNSKVIGVGLSTIAGFFFLNSIVKYLACTYPTVFGWFKNKDADKQIVRTESNPVNLVDYGKKYYYGGRFFDGNMVVSVTDLLNYELDDDDMVSFKTFDFVSQSKSNNNRGSRRTTAKRLTVKRGEQIVFDTKQGYDAIDTARQEAVLRTLKNKESIPRTDDLVLADYNVSHSVSATDSFNIVTVVDGKVKKVDLDVPESVDFANKLSRLIRNTFIIDIYVYPPGKERICLGTIRGLGLRGCLGLVPWHLVHEIFMACANAYNDLVIELVLSDKYGFSAIKNCSFNQCKFVRLGTLDLCLIKFSKDIPSFVDITKMFVKETNFPHLPKNLMFFEQLLNDTGVTITHLRELDTELVIRPGMYDSTVDSQFDLVEVYNLIGFKYKYGAPGVCGSLLIDPKNVRVCGMHVAGEADGGWGYSVLLCQEMLEPYLSEAMVEDVCVDFPLQKQGSPNMILDGNFSPIGSFKAPMLNTETDFIPSECIKIFSDEIKFAPAILSYKGEVSPGYGPLSSAMSKMLSPPIIPFHHWSMKKAVSVIKENILNNCTPIMRDVVVRTPEQALCGIPGQEFMGALKRDTSTGYPLNVMGLTRKSDIFNYEETNLGLKIDFNKSDAKFLSIFNNNNEMRSKGIVPPTMWFEFLKDETLPLEKLSVQGKTRCIDGAPLDLSIVQRQYTMDFAAAFMNCRHNLNHGVGMNVYSLEWNNLANRLLSKGNYCVDADYSGFGPGISTYVIWCAYEIIYDWYKHNGCEIDRKIWNVIVDEHLYRNSLVGDKGVKVMKGMASGNTLTAIINSIVNLLYLVAVFDEVCMDVDSNYCGYDFFDFVAPVVYGDDFLLSISGHVIGFFNGVTISQKFAEHNIKVTPASKNSQMQKHMELSTCTFLKHSFVWNKDESIYQAGLDKDVIENIPNYCRFKIPDKEAQVKVLVRDALRLASFWGRDYYNVLLEKANTYCESNRLAVSVPDYDEMVKIVKKCGVYPQKKSKYKYVNCSMCKCYYFKYCVMDVEYECPNPECSLFYMKGNDICFSNINSTYIIGYDTYPPRVSFV